MIIGIIGLLFIYMGYLLWRKEKISLLHAYHYGKVSETDKKAFCSLAGKGVFVKGVGILVSGVTACILDSGWSVIPLAIAFVVGLLMLIIAGLKYNH